ncbi:MAG: leucine-rich repeat protein [Lachnospiraceae bacterium]|nr:leucine-rich repeat protein [Lachnospiraceae bacterium]
MKRGVRGIRKRIVSFAIIVLLLVETANDAGFAVLASEDTAVSENVITEDGITESAEVPADEEVDEVSETPGADLEGDCGFTDEDDVSWQLVGNNLRITGTGRMAHFSDSGNPVPWEEYRDDICSVTIGYGVTEIEGFSKCNNLTQVSISLTVTTIRRSTFSGCTSLQEITIPEGVVSIGSDAFYRCSSLQSISLPDGLNAIAGGTFASCGTLKRIDIPYGVTSIGSDAFKYCYELEEITLPEGLYSIGTNAFTGTKIKVLNLPATLYTYEGMWNNDILLETINVDPANSYFKSVNGILFNKQVTELLYWPPMKQDEEYTIPRGVITAKIKQGVLSSSGASYGKLKKLYIPKSMNSLDIYMSTLTDIYFEGTPEEWNALSKKKINVGSGSYTVHYGEYHSVLLSGYEEEQPKVEVKKKEYYSVTDKKLFRISPIVEGLPKPSGFSVEADGKTFTENVKGYNDITAIFPNTYSGDVKISREGFYTFNMPRKIVGQYNVITMYPDTNKDVFVQGLFLNENPDKSYVSYKNVLKDAQVMYPAKITGDNPVKNIDIYPIVNWNGHGEGEIYLQQGEGRPCPLQNNTSNIYDWFTLNFQKTINAEPIYIVCKASDGQMIKQPVQIKVYERYDAGITVDMGESFDIPTPDKSGGVDILKSGDLEISFEKMLKDSIPVNFSVKDDLSVEGTIGWQFASESVKDSYLGTIKEVFAGTADATSIGGQFNPSGYREGQELDKIDKLMTELDKNGVFMKESTSTFAVSGKVSLVGYFSGQIYDGHLGFNELKLAIVIKGSGSYTFQAVPPETPVPGYFKISLEVAVESFLKMSYSEEKQKLVPDLDNDLKASITLSPEIGLGWEGFISIGAKGSGTLTMKTLTPIKPDKTTLSLSAKISAVGTIAGVSGEWTPKALDFGEYVFYENGAGTWYKKEEESAGGAADGENDEFVFDLSQNYMTATDEENAIIAGMNGYQDPAVTTLSDGRLMAVWAADVPGRKAADSGALIYSICTDGVWGTNEFIYDDSTNDSVPVIHKENGKIHLAWANYSGVYDSDDLPDMDTLCENNVIVESVFDEVNMTWSLPEIGEPAWYRAAVMLPSDYVPAEDGFTAFSKYHELDGRKVLSRLAADENGELQVYAVVADEYGWGSQPVKLTREDGGVNGYDLVLTEESITVLYTKGEYAASTLKCISVSWDVDAELVYTDYDRETIAPGAEMLLKLFVYNNSLSTMNGVRAEIRDENDKLLKTEDIMVRFYAGESKLLECAVLLPADHSGGKLKVSITPMNETEKDTTDNNMDCDLCMTDISLENCRAEIDDAGVTHVIMQAVNRGQTKLSSTGVKLRLNGSDGEVLAMGSIPALDPGELADISLSSNKVKAGDMVYASADGFANENLFYNNTAFALAASEAGIMTAEVSSYIIPLQGIALSENMVVRIGETLPMGVTYTPEDASDKTLEWKSDNPSVATVDEKGNVTGVKCGYAVIMATASDGGYTASSRVKVSPAHADDGKLKAWISEEDLRNYKIPEEKNIVRRTDTVKTGPKNNQVTVNVSISMNYVDAVVYTGKVITPKNCDALSFTIDLCDLMKKAGVNGIKQEELFKISFVGKSKNAGAGEFYAKISLVPKAKKMFGLSSQQVKDLKKLIKAVNKMLKKKENRVKFTINKASIVSMLPVEVHAKADKQGRFKYDGDKLKKLKYVKLKLNPADTKLKKFGKSNYTIKVVDAANNKVRVKGAGKNYTGHIVTEVMR